MAKIKIGLMLIFSFIALLGFTIESDLGAISKQATFNQISIDQSIDWAPSMESVVLTYRYEVGVRERTGNNDGARVEQYLASAKMARGNPWCAAFVHFCFSINDIETVKNPAWSPSWFGKEHLIYIRDYYLAKIPDVGDVFGIYFQAKGRIAHVGFLDDAWNNDSKFIATVEGNTNEAGSREGDGVYRKLRLKSQIYAVSSNFI
jgi:hypothetical protein